LNKNNLKFYIAAVTLFVGFIAGWFVKHDTLWIQYEDPPSWYHPTDEERLVSSIRLGLSCDGHPARDFNGSFMMSLLSKSVNLGFINKNTHGEYHINKPSLLGDVTDFGWKVADDYSEFFYFTTKSYSAAAKLFKQTPDRSGVTNIVTEKRLSIDGWRASELIQITKHASGARIACREYNQSGKVN
jgi:hypothetical protein